MASRLATGALQPDGEVRPEATMDVKHVADAVVHIANLPNTVTILEMIIMFVLSLCCSVFTEVHANTHVQTGRRACLSWGADNFCQRKDIKSSLCIVSESNEIGCAEN